MNHFNWDGGFTLDFNLVTGRSKTAAPSKRYLSQMRDMYADATQADAILREGDPIIYEWYELGCPERAGDLIFGTTILHAGKVGREYYMTKGHFHTQLETAEVYYTLHGEGYMMMENMAGDTMEMSLNAGEVLYVPRGYAHRTVNTGREDLVLFFTFAADAGHDYGTIETKGYRKLMLEKDSKPFVEENPKWK